MTEDLATPLRAAGAIGWVHAVDIDTGREVGLDADRRVAISSVAKVPLLVAFFRQADAGRLDPRQACDVPVAGRTLGVSGVSLFADHATISLRDLALLMITISDNAAADLLFDAVGVDVVQHEMRTLGLGSIAIRETLRDAFAALREDTGGASPLEALADGDLRDKLRMLDPERLQ